MLQKLLPHSMNSGKGVAKFVLGEKQQIAFETLKESIISPPVLRMPDFSKQFVLQTEASSVALGAVLSQVVDGGRQPVAFISRTVTQQERSHLSMNCLLYTSRCV